MGEAVNNKRESLTGTQQQRVSFAQVPITITAFVSDGCDSGDNDDEEFVSASERLTSLLPATTKDEDESAASAASAAAAARRGVNTEPSHGSTLGVGNVDQDATCSPSSLSSSFKSKQLRGNLTREQHNRDPLFYYQVVSVVGVGSMGSVAKVRKRPSVVGGSARKQIQDHFRKQRQLQSCFQLPLVGGLFHYCLKGAMEYRELSERSQGSNSLDHTKPCTSNKTSSVVSGSTGSSILQTRTNIVEDYNDGHGDQSGSGCEMLFAMKSIHLSRVTDQVFIDELKNEIDILRTLDHPHIVRAIETFEHRNQIFIVMELCHGGDLYTRDPYTEAEAARITSSILSAVAYMHSKGIIHRDLKYENILFASTDPRAEVKLIDFGLSKAFGQDDLTEGVGTIYTMAPEVLKGKYTKKADVWSVGVIAYMLMSSQMPFYGRQRRQIVDLIMKGQYEFKGRRWKRLSSQSKEFVRDLLIVDPNERVTAEEALSAGWLNRRLSATMRNPDADEELSAHKSLVRYSRYNKLKKVALMVIAHKSTSQEIGILRKVFQKYDTAQVGHLSYDEFKAALKDAGYSEDMYRQMFDAVDLDGTGLIRYTEFLAATIEAQGAISEERLAEAFDRIDSDDSGYITKENLRDLLGNEIAESEIDSIIAEADRTKDGQISYAEFLALWENQIEIKRNEALREIMVIRLHDDSSDRSVDMMSDLDSEISSPEEIVARANFIERKKLSERKAREAVDPSIEGGDTTFFSASMETPPP